MPTLALLLLQLVVSAKPGLVDIATGETSVRQYEQVVVGKSIRTGPHGHVQISLGWTAFLRLDENSSAVLESLDPSDVAVRLESGTGLIEVPEMNKGTRLNVTSGALIATIETRGVYRFAQNTATIIEGKLKIPDASMELESDWQITRIGETYQKTKLDTDIASEFKRFMGSPGSGLVNAIEGRANVRLHQRVQKGLKVETGPDSYVELLLTPGSFLRLAENSSVVFESSNLNNTVVRVLSGNALMETVAMEPRFSVSVRLTDSLKVRIDATGVYRFTADTASVTAGALQIDLQKQDQDYRIGKGHAIRATATSYDETTAPSDAEDDAIDRWSAERSYALATANFMAEYGDSRPNFFLFQSRSPMSAAWIFSPPLNGFTFMPRHRCASHYEDVFVPLYVFLPPPELPAAPAFPDFPMPRRPVITPPSSIPSSGSSGPPASTAPRVPSQQPAPNSQ